MIGLDTNVLLQLFIEGDDAQQCERARAFVDKAGEDEPCLINLVVMVEFVWVLAKSFKKQKREVLKYIHGLLESDDLEIERRSAAFRAYEAYSSGAADFADCLIAEINADLGCATTATFDRNASQAKLFSPVP